MSKKSVFYTAGGVILFGAVIAYIMLPDRGIQGTFIPTPTGQSPLPQAGGNTDSAVPGSTPTVQQTIRIRSRLGQVMEIPDPTVRKPVSTIGTHQYYDLTENQQMQGFAAQFEIVYGTDFSISIILLKEPVGQSRRAAENALRQFFPLSNEQLCSLDITVSIPLDVNELYPGVNVGPSFCPGSVRLPE
jgi:hypothetical protein